MADSPPRLARILEPEMRQLFNNGRYIERVLQGELTIVTTDDRPAPPSAGQVPGTKSQMLSYRDRDNNEVARAHQYLKPDGTIGGSGRPDPKRLLHEGVLYRLLKAKDRLLPLDPSEH